MSACKKFSAERQAQTPSLTQSAASSSGSLADALLETAIAVTTTELVHAHTRDERIAVMKRLRDLHGQRSAAQIRRLEIQLGLAQ